MKLQLKRFSLAFLAGMLVVVFALSVNANSNQKGKQSQDNTQITLAHGHFNPDMGKCGDGKCGKGKCGEGKCGECKGKKKDCKHKECDVKKHAEHSPGKKAKDATTKKDAKAAVKDAKKCGDGKCGNGKCGDGKNK